MLTALVIKDIISKKWYKKVLNKIRGNKIETEILKAGSVSLKYVTYINRVNNINWKKLDMVIGNQRNHLLCSSELQLPNNLGYKRFDNIEFKTRLASNLFIQILAQLNVKDLRVALYDPKGQCTEVLPYIVKYVANPVVVTDNLTAFEYEINNIYEEYGATIQLTNNRSNLMGCTFVLAPLSINEMLPLSADTIVLSSCQPSVVTSGILYYNYDFKMPNQFDNLKTDDFSEEYICGALYTKAGQFELGSIVPLICSNQSSAQTGKSLCNYLKKHSEQVQENKSK